MALIEDPILQVGQLVGTLPNLVAALNGSTVVPVFGYDAAGGMALASLPLRATNGLRVQGAGGAGVLSGTGNGIEVYSQSGYGQLRAYDRSANTLGPMMVSATVMTGLVGTFQLIDNASNAWFSVDTTTRLVTMNKLSVAGNSTLAGGLFAVDGPNEVVHVGSAAAPGRFDTYGNHRSFATLKTAGGAQTVLDSSGGDALPILNPGETVVLTPGSAVGYLALIRDTTSGASAIVAGGQVATLIMGDATLWSAAMNTASKINVYVDAADGYKLKGQNYNATARTLRVSFVRF